MKTLSEDTADHCLSVPLCDIIVSVSLSAIEQRDRTKRGTIGFEFRGILRYKFKLRYNDQDTTSACGMLTLVSVSRHWVKIRSWALLHHYGARIHRSLSICTGLFLSVSLHIQRSLLVRPFPEYEDFSCGCELELLCTTVGHAFIGLFSHVQVCFYQSLYVCKGLFWYDSFQNVKTSSADAILSSVTVLWGMHP